MNLLRNLISGLLCISLLIVVGGGCASKPTLRRFFDRESEHLNPPEQRLLVETLQVIVLLEEYQDALENQDLKSLISCYSSGYSYYERGLDWHIERIQERYFALFEELSASFWDIEIELIRKETGYWMRQEDFDWLRTRDMSSRPSGSYLIALETPDGVVEMDLGEPCKIRPQRVNNPSPPGDSPRKVPVGAKRVTVRSSVDHGVERPMGEVSYRILLKGELAGCEGSEVFTSSLEEKEILLLEKEQGEWKIISQW